MPLRDLVIYLPLIYENKLLIPHPDELFHMNELITKQCLFLLEGMRMSESRNCIVFLNSEKEANAFQTICEEANKKYFFSTSLVKNISEEGFYQLIIYRYEADNKPFDYPDSIFINNFNDNFINNIRFSKSLDEDRVLEIFLWCDSIETILPKLYLIEENSEYPENGVSSKMFAYMYNFDSEKEICEKANKTLTEQIKNYFFEQNKLKPKQQISSEKIAQTYEEKLELLFDYCNTFKKTPPKGTNYKGVNIADWFQHQKQKIKSFDDKIYIDLIKNNIVKENVDLYFSKKEIEVSTNDKIKLLFEYCEKHNALPEYETHVNNVHLRSFLQTSIGTIHSEKDERYIALSKNKHVKEFLDKKLIFTKTKSNQTEKTEVSQNKRNTFDDNVALLFEFVEHHKRICSYSEKWRDHKLGEWYSKFRNKLFQKDDYKSEKTYLQLIKNEIVKKSLDEYFDGRK